MIISSWPTTVNTKFFSYSHKRADNSVVTSFLSGRKAGFNNNTRNIDTLTCSLLLSTSEDSAFWAWFDSIGGCAGAFTCSALGNKNYRFTEVPEPSNSSQGYITLELNIEEVY